jgi:hypothetical protein
MRTVEEVRQEIHRLKSLRPRLKETFPVSVFGDDNVALLDEEVEALRAYVESGGEAPEEGTLAQWYDWVSGTDDARPSELWEDLIGPMEAP